MLESDNLKLKRNLTALVEFSRIINSSLDLEFILNNILLTCMGKSLATKGIIALNENKKLKIKVSKGLLLNIVEICPEIKTATLMDNDESFKLFLSNCNLQTFEKIYSSSIESFAFFSSFGLIFNVFE